MTRRELVILLVGAAVLGSRPSHAQQTARPVIGLLDSSSPAVWPFLEDFRKGLTEAGFVAGRNVRIEYRWAEGHYDRLPGLAAELVRIPVSVIAATGITAALAAKASTTTLPIVFHTGGDPVKSGLVANLAKPGAT
jgi:putative ABC transport system substrate-binding protein